MSRSRMSSREFFHVWAQGDVDWAHANGKGRECGNIRASADIETRAVRLYSYSEHIASVVLTPGLEGRRKVVLVKSRPDRGSVTTSSHLTQAYSAAPNLRFQVPHVEPANQEQHVENAHHLLSVAKELYAKAERARTNKPRLVLAAHDSYSDAIKYAELFGIVRFEMDPLDNTEKLERVLQEAWKSAEADKQERARKAREAERGVLERWLNNGTAHPPSSLQTDETGSVYLRLTLDGAVETSRGATVPLHHAMRLFKLCEAARESRTPVDRPLRVGHYTLNNIDVNGDAVVGCHRISFERMSELRAKLDANAVATAEAGAGAAITEMGGV